MLVPLKAQLNLPAEVATVYAQLIREQQQSALNCMSGMHMKRDAQPHGAVVRQHAMQNG